MPVEVTDAMKAAKAQADALNLANEALRLWSATQRDLLWTLNHAAGWLDQSIQLPPQAADAVNGGATLLAATVQYLVVPQGQALYASFGRAGPLMPQIQTALAALGFDSATVPDTYNLIIDACDQMRNLAADGSTYQAFADYCAATFTAPASIF